MKVHRFIIDLPLFDHKEGDFVSVENKEIIDQVKNVLKLKVGESIIILDGKLFEAEATIVHSIKDSLELRIGRISQNRKEIGMCVVLYASLLKKENFELVLQKTTEVGVSEIHPIISERTVKTGVREDRFLKIIKEAAEQSERGYVPRLSSPQSFKDVCNILSKEECVIMCDPRGEEWKNIDPGSGVNRVNILVGPEGGWTDYEIEYGKKCGFCIVSLGSFVLRAETASIIASFLAGKLSKSS